MCTFQILYVMTFLGSEAGRSTRTIFVLLRAQAKGQGNSSPASVSFAVG